MHAEKSFTFSHVFPSELNGGGRWWCVCVGGGGDLGSFRDSRVVRVNPVPLANARALALRSKTANLSYTIVLSRYLILEMS